MSSSTACSPGARDVANVAPVIINWKRPDETCACIHALVQIGVQPETIIVLDNGSLDGSTATIRQRFPGVVVLALPYNLGFGKAANIGIRCAIQRGAGSVFLLNNDAVVAEDTIPKLIDAMRQSPRRGMVSAKVFLSDKPDRLWAVGALFRQKVINVGTDEPDHGQYDAFPLDALYGCALLLRVEMLEQVGLFDERFFLYYEDVDLSLRATAAGYTLALAPDAHVWHAGSESTSHQPSIKVFHHARSRIIFFSKHLRPDEQWSFFVQELRYALITAARLLLARDPQGAAARLAGVAAGVLDMGRERLARVVQRGTGQSEEERKQAYGTQRGITRGPLLL